MKEQRIDWGLLILRISIGGIMLVPGTTKILHGIDSVKYLLNLQALPEFLAYGVYFTEVVIPILLIIGFRTRLSAMIYVLNMLVIILLAHTENIFKLTEFGSWAAELVGLYTFGALALCFTGAGKFAVSNKSTWD